MMSEEMSRTVKTSNSTFFNAQVRITKKIIDKLIQNVFLGWSNKGSAVMFALDA